MGRGFVLKCSNCKYEIDVQLGIGFMIGRETRETITEMKSGAYGNKAKEFFHDNPDGTVDCKFVLLKCDRCGALKNARDLSLYKRIEGTDAPKHPLPNPNFFIKAENFEHRCKTCGNTMRVVDTSNTDFFEKIQKGEICCPICKHKFKREMGYKWD